MDTVSSCVLNVGMRTNAGWRAKLKDARERARLSQEALAEKVGVSQTSIDKYENTNTSPSLNTLLTMARVLDISLDWLFDDARTETLDVERSFRGAVARLGVERAYDRLGHFDVGPLLPRS